MPTQDRPPSSGQVSKLTPGKDTNTGTNRFQVGPIFQYPVDLNNNELKHYITFELIGRGKSETTKNSKGLQQVKANPDNANLTEDQRSGLGTAAIGAGALGAGTTAYAATGVVKSLTEKVRGILSGTGAKSLGSSEAGRTGLVIGTVAAGTVGVGMIASELLKPDTKYRLKEVIALYVDGPPTVRYGMNYTNKDLGSLAGLLGGAIGDTMNTLTSSESAAAIGLQAAKLPGMFSGVDISTAAQKNAGVSLNPFKEVIFESVDFRTFQFKYRFFPRSPEESRRVKDIISLFKYHMHPEMSNNKLFYIYPSEFIITYYYNNERNDYFHRFANCVLEQMDVSYGGEQFSSFSDGSPTEINMSLTFRETELLTKKMIDQGY